MLTERGDTVTENALLAAARYDGVTVIRNASSNYMVQDLCFFLEALGVKVEASAPPRSPCTACRTSTSTWTTPPPRTRSRR